EEQKKLEDQKRKQQSKSQPKSGIQDEKSTERFDLFEGGEKDIENVAFEADGSKRDITGSDSDKSKKSDKGSKGKKEGKTKNIDSSKNDFYSKNSSEERDSESLSNRNSDISRHLKRDNSEQVRAAKNSEYGHLIRSSRLISTAIEEYDKPYLYGATGPDRFDCSGFTSHVFRKNGIKIPRTSANQAEQGEFVERRNLRSGDLIFFDTRAESKVKVGVGDSAYIRPSKVTHVGIYMGEGKFIHASSGAARVVVTDLNIPYYSQRYYGARRYSR
ncbi:MAG: C40 family peptidase, partial [Filifactor alocis]|nr:C40 family peptidase [Filifactor alocis]